MPRSSKSVVLLFALAVLGMILPPRAVYSATSRMRAVSESGEAQIEWIQDIALDSGGTLSGQIVDSSGRAQSEARVLLSQDNQTLVETRTDAMGRFAIHNLRGGVYQIQFGESLATCRLWAPGTAPPSASQGMLMVVGEEIERGQFARDIFPYGTVQPSTRAVILGSLIGAGIFVPLYTGRDRNPGS